MWARPWPNGQGWDVGINAEVVKLENGLGVRIITDAEVTQFRGNGDALAAVEIEVKGGERVVLPAH